MDDGISKSEYEARVKRCKEEMAKEGLGALVVYSYKSGATKYLCGYSPRWSVTNAALYLLPIDGDPLLLTRLQFHLPTVMREAVIDNVKVCGAAKLGTTPMDAMAEEGVAYLQKFGKSEGRIGLAGYAPEMGIEAPLRKLLPKATIVDSNAMLDKMRQLKSENEVRLLVKSTEIANYAYEEALSGARPGRWEVEILASAEAAMRRKGATAVHLFFGHVTDEKTYHRPAKRKLERGDVVRMELIPEYEGYWSERVGYSAIEMASDDLKEAFNAVVDAHFKVVENMKPGLTVGEVVELMKKEGSGFHKRLGHGMGLDNIERPETISETDTTVLEPGMVFAVHPNVMAPKYGSFTWGGAVVVTKKGAKSLLPMYPNFVV